MVRLLAMLIFVLALAASARADTSIVISGGGFAFFSGSDAFAHVHRHHHRHRHHHHHDGSIWRQHQGDGWSFYRPSRRHLLLGQAHGHGALLRHKHRYWQHGHGWGFEGHHHRPQIVIVVPGSVESRIKIVTAPGQPSVATVFDQQAGASFLTPRPILKPTHLAAGQ